MLQFIIWCARCAKCTQTDSLITCETHTCVYGRVLVKSFRQLHWPFFQTLESKAFKLQLQNKAKYQKNKFKQINSSLLQLASLIGSENARRYSQSIGDLWITDFIDTNCIWSCTASSCYCLANHHKRRLANTMINGVSSSEWRAICVTLC